MRRYLFRRPFDPTIRRNSFKGVDRRSLELNFRPEFWKVFGRFQARSALHSLLHCLHNGHGYMGHRHNDTTLFKVLKINQLSDPYVNSHMLSFFPTGAALNDSYRLSRTLLRIIYTPCFRQEIILLFLFPPTSVAVSPDHDHDQRG